MKKCDCLMFDERTGGLLECVQCGRVYIVKKGDKPDKPRKRK